METELLSKIQKDLEFVKREIIEIKEHMVDADTILTPEEEKGLDTSIKNYRKGKTKDFEAIKREKQLRPYLIP